MHRTDWQAPVAESDLQESLHALAALVTDSLGLDELLARVAAFAAHAIPGADGVGVTLLEGAAGVGHDAAESIVQGLAATQPFVAELDELQYRVVHEGPCLSATREQRTMRSASLGGDRRWPHFGPRAGRLGVHSALSLPLLLSGQAVGSVNVYSRSRSAFDERAERLGEQFAAPAAVAVHNAQVLARAQELATQLQAALTSRAVIDQAIGVLRARTGGSTQQAFDLLRATSQRDQTRLADVALQLVEAAVRRAAARHAPAGQRPGTPPQALTASTQALP